MKTINGNASVILGMVSRGELKNEEIVYSSINKQKYQVVVDGEFMSLKEV